MEFLIQGFEQFNAYMNSGGYVMWPLAISVLVLWYALGYRYYTLNRGSKASVRNLVRKFQEGIRSEPKGMIDAAVVEGLAIVKEQGPGAMTREYITDAYNKYTVEIKKFSTLIKTIVAAAPLIGLLGTVIGMIETFDSLADAALFSQSGGIAGGISQALFTTQLGLVVAVPGLVIGNILQRRADKMLMDLEQIKDIICIKEEGE